MIRPSVLLRTGGAVILAAALSGCISLLPKSKPVQLYTFGEQVAATPAPDMCSLSKHAK